MQHMQLVFNCISMDSKGGTFSYSLVKKGLSNIQVIQHIPCCGKSQDKLYFWTMNFL